MTMPLSNFNSKSAQIFLTIIFLLIISLPYVINIQQDLLTQPVANPLVCHDEAALAMNAKDILLFGRDYLVHDRIYVLGPFNIISALISFFLFGISLASLRLPYIILNLLGNIAFFDFLRRTTGKTISVIATCFFALSFSRIVIGKSAMAESAILPMLLILCWILFFAYPRQRLYFYLGFLAALAGVSKPDNAIVFFLLIPCALFDDWKEGRHSQRPVAFRRLRWLFFGAGSLIFVWLIYIFVLFSFKQFALHYKFELLCNDIRFLRFGFYGHPGSFALIKNNLLKIWEWDPLFAVLSLVSVLIAGGCSIFDRNVLRNPVWRAGLLFLGLILFKVVFSSYFVGQWRLAPCYPLPFFALAYASVALPGLVKALSNNSLRRCCCLAVIVLGLGVLGYISPFIIKSVQSTAKLILRPAYRIIGNAEYLRKTLHPESRVIFSEGHFAYCALFLPNKCYDVIPNLAAKEFDLLESDPQKIWETIQFDRQIAYLMVRPVNQAVMEFAQAIPGAELILTDALPFEPGYVYQIRRPQTDKKSPSKFRGEWEE